MTTPDGASRVAIGSVAVAIGALASLALWTIAEHGLGVNPDSTIYLDAAANLLAGRGVTADGLPLTHYPPAYPIVLAIAGGAGRLVGLDLLASARPLHALLFGLNAILLASLVFVATARSRVAAIAALLFFVSARPVLTLHAYAWSEPLFLTCTFVLLLALGAYAARPRTSAIVIAALFAGAAVATRYHGIALCVPLAVTLLLVARRDRWRWRDVALASLLAALPMLLWLARNVIVSGTATNRTFDAHPIGVTELRMLVVSLHDCVLDLALPVALKDLLVATGLAMAIAAAWTYARTRLSPSGAIGTIDEVERRATATTILSLATACCYLAFLLFSISFLDWSTSPDRRLIAPAVLIAAPGLFALVRQATRAWRLPALAYAGLAFVAILVIVNGVVAARWAADVRRNGQEYESPAWHGSATIAWVRGLAGNVTIYTNDPGAIRFLAGRPARLIPLTFVVLTGRDNPGYDSEVEAWCRAVERQEAMLVWLDRTGLGFMRERADLESSCPSLQRRALADGTVYAARFDDLAPARTPSP